MTPRYHINIYRRYWYWRSAKCIFIHVPKAAGTSINHAIYGRTLGHYKAIEVNAIFPKLYEKCFVFSVVRNPWDRLVSAYRFAIKGATGEMAIKNPEAYRGRQFRSFPAFVHEWLQEKNIRELDFVFQPQVDFLCDKSGAIMVDHYGKLEELSATIDLVRSRAARNFYIDRMNVTSIGESYISYYDSELVDIVQGIYKEDVRVLDYAFE